MSEIKKALDDFKKNLNNLGRSLFVLALLAGFLTGVFFATVIFYLLRR